MEEGDKGMPIDDDILYDAINAFALSRTGQGRSPLGQLGPDVAKTLWDFRKAKLIDAKDLPPGLEGHHEVDGLGTNKILIERDRVPREFAAGGMAYLSLILVHEAVHYLIKWRDGDDVSEEVRCRRLELYYWDELTSGGVRLNRPRSTDGAVVLSIRRQWGSYPNEWDYMRKAELVDFVINMRAYREKADIYWIKRNLGEWGGLSNRWATTKAIYLSIAVKRTGGVGITKLEVIYRVLESIRNFTEWLKVRNAMTNDRLLGRRAVTRLYRTVNSTRNFMRQPRDLGSSTILDTRELNIERRIGSQIFHPQLLLP